MGVLMKTGEVLRSTAGRHIGYMPQSIWEHSSEPLCWSIAGKLRIIPSKISAYFNRELLAEVRKAKTVPEPGLYYFKLTDGTFLEVEY